MMVIDITGNRYGRLTVLGLDRVESGYSYWTCRCDCGNVVVLRKSAFAYWSSKQKSCGCLHRENSSARMKAMHEKMRQERKVRENEMCTLPTL